MTDSKKCFKCNETKPLTDFYSAPRMADGRQGKCKTCCKADVADNRLKNIDRIRAYDRDRGKNKDRMKSASEISKRWRHEDGRRVAAHSAVARAIRSGALVRQPCERCGAVKAYAHHEDYDKKLEVMWLCQPCHKQRHKELLTQP
jgi:hypothetical protein